MKTFQLRAKVSVMWGSSTNYLSFLFHVLYHMHSSLSGSALADTHVMDKVRQHLEPRAALCSEPRYLYPGPSSRSYLALKFEIINFPINFVCIKIHL